MWSHSSSPFVSIIVVTYNNENDIADCLDSILNQDYQDFEVIVVDNSSTDRTVERIIDKFAKDVRVKLIESKENTGYAGGNNIGFQNSKGEFVVLLNPDLVVDKEWLVNLVQACELLKDNIGIVCSNVLLFDKQDTINACGNIIHLTGFVFSRFYMEKESKCHECDDYSLDNGSLTEKQDGEVLLVPVAAPSGASMMFSRSSLQKIGRDKPFDTGRFVMEYSDIDLALDFLSYDLYCYVAPKSKVFHKFHFKMNPERLATLERGRYQLLGHLTVGTRFSLLSSLILAEIIVWTFIVGGRNKNRWSMIRSKLGTYLWLFGHNNVSINRNSKAKDLKIIQAMSPNLIIYNEMASKEVDKMPVFLNTANRLFARSRERIRNSLQRWRD